MGEIVCESGGIWEAGWIATCIVYIFAQLGWVGIGGMLLVVIVGEMVGMKWDEERNSKCNDTAKARYRGLSTAAASAPPPVRDDGFGAGLKRAVVLRTMPTLATIKPSRRWGSPVWWERKRLTQR